MEYVVLHDFHSANEEIEAQGCSYLIEVIVTEGILICHFHLGLLPLYLNVP